MRLHRATLIVALLLLAVIAPAQTARDDFSADRSLSASNFVAYDGPHGSLTPAPRGKRPFYISHYGRHGSRYQTKAIDYDYAYFTLLRADGEGALSALGCDVLERLRLIREESFGRLGDLTPLGAQQQRLIARRMVERFPEVFKGDARIDARSTTTPRCILSMAAFTNELLQCNRRLDIVLDASEHDHYYMRRLYTPMNNRRAMDHYLAFCREHECHSRVVGQLFADTSYVRNYVNGERLCYYLFREASNLQSSELRHSVTLYDLFTSDEVHQMWLKENASWFLGFGFSSLNGGEMPFSQCDLLRAIISEADSCMQLERPCCSLRFGHETMLLPLVCLMDLNGYGRNVDDVRLLEQLGWHSYRIFPMACNVQMVFYRSNADDDDPLVKVLLNEDEATLPVDTDTPPYYHWRDVRSHYLQMLDDHEDRQR